MSLESFKRSARTITKVKHVSLQCAAEPLLNKHLMEMIRFIKQVNGECQVGFVTNGTFLKQKASAELLNRSVLGVASGFVRQAGGLVGGARRH
jgi:wyosine [tRNA(Phe)-imidazoG37] synthetase (radical SAM superfamily)